MRCFCFFRRSGHANDVERIEEKAPEEASQESNVSMVVHSSPREGINEQLLQAAQAGHIKQCNILVSKGADCVSVLDDDKNTALHWLCRTCRTEEDLHFFINSLPTQQLRRRNGLGQRPLICAAVSGNRAALSALGAVYKERGLKVCSETDAFANNALHCAVSACSVDSVIYLLNRRWYSDLLRHFNNYAETPVIMAIRLCSDMEQAGDATLEAMREILNLLIKKQMESKSNSTPRRPATARTDHLSKLSY